MFVQTIVIVILFLIGVPYVSVLWVTLIALWGSSATLFYEHRRLRRLLNWSAWQYERGQRFMDEARNNKEAIARTMTNLASANRQLALASERMATLRKSAEEAQSAKAAFVANVSHEFRTPLNMIIGLVQLMVDSPQIYTSIISPKMRSDLETVHRNCLHLASMVDDVLDLTRTQAGRVVLRREHVDLADVIQRSAEAVYPLILEKHLALDLDLASGLEAYCDRTRIQQVILNLLSNAARFTERGGITVTARQEHAEIEISVADTGPGIAPEERDRLFEPFWQSQNPAQRGKGGTGLGLSISREFVQRHGGRMWVESALGIGTTFRFTLPVSPPIEIAGHPGHTIREDWIWREEGFRSAAEVIDSADLLRPRIVLWDQGDILQGVVERNAEEVEVVRVPDLDAAVREVSACLTHALVVNASDSAALWSCLVEARAVIEGVPIVGLAVSREMRREVAARARGYLVKPVRRTDIEQIVRAAEPRVSRVLIVDDDPDVLDLLARQLHLCNASIEVVGASSGTQALTLLEREPFDLMLLDIIMPEMNGWQLLEAIAANRRLDDVAVYVISAQDPVEHEPASHYLGYVDASEGIAASQAFSLALRVVQTLKGS